ncbi:MAG: hypothetical protein U5R06_12340 [candidate division KSB1 bacterium]|nr:hypothetical protein [candidate division KSB1 bacterium]
MMKNFTKNNVLLLATMCLVMFYAGSFVYAQKVIEPGLGTINETIMGDTLSDGSRAETHYILKQDGWYIYTETMHIDFSLTLEAEAGDGARPVIKPVAMEGGATRPFEIRNSGVTVTFRGCHVDGHDNSLPAPGLRSDEYALRVYADDVRIVIDDCRWDRVPKYIFRTDNPGTDFILTNSTFGNFYKDGWPLSSGFIRNKSEGDTLVVSNSTIYNGGVFCRSDNTMWNYTKIEHCTFVNLMGCGDWDRNKTDSLRAEISQTWAVVNTHESKMVVFRNNLLVNTGILGRHTEEALVPQYVVGTEMIPVDTLGNYSLPDGVDIRNNNIWFDSALEGAYGDSVELYTQDRFYDPTMQTFIDSLDRAWFFDEYRSYLRGRPQNPGRMG